MRSRLSGFTLVELMIVVVIVAILSAIAIPSYRNYVMRSETKLNSDRPKAIHAHTAAAATMRTKHPRESARCVVWFSARCSTAVLLWLTEASARYVAQMSPRRRSSRQCPMIVEFCYRAQRQR